jgi:hypothetical protein
VKRLIVIPVIHNQADLGSLADSVRAHYARHFGPAVWQEHQRAVAKLWSATRRAIDALRLDFSLVRIYQDGLPICGKEAQIVRELAAAGSLNHQLVLELTGKGADLVGTEDPQLLICEYQLQRRRLSGGAGGKGSGSSPGEEAELLAARDRFIAARVAATLEERQTGLLFLGAAHRLDAAALPGIAMETLHQG